MWPGEFMSTFIYALNDNEVVWIPSKSGIFSILSVGIKLEKRNLLLVGGRLYGKVYDIFSSSLFVGRLCLIEFYQRRMF